MGWFRDKLNEKNPGSSVNTAKTFCENYNRFVSLDGDHRSAIETVCNQRKGIWAMSGVDISDPMFDKLAYYCAYDLPTLVFVCMYLESPVFRKAVNLSDSSYERQGKDIYNKVYQMSPDAIKKNYTQFISLTKEVLF